MKYSKLMIPVAALFLLSSCSPKISGGAGATDNSASASTTTGTAAANTSDDAQKANISIQAQGEAKDMKPSTAPAAAPTY